MGLRHIDVIAADCGSLPSSLHSVPGRHTEDHSVSAFGVEIARVIDGLVQCRRNGLAHRHSGRLQVAALLTVAGYESDPGDIERPQHCSGHKELSRVLGVPKRSVCVEGVQPLFLETIGLHLRVQPDAPALLAEINEVPTVHRDALERFGELGTAVATTGSEGVAREALGMHSHEGYAIGWALVRAHAENDMLLLADAVKGEYSADGLSVPHRERQVCPRPQPQLLTP